MIKILPLLSIKEELKNHRDQLDSLTAQVVKEGVAVWSGSDDDNAPALIVRGQSHLLEDVDATNNLERIRTLFEALEAKESMSALLEKTDTADGVQIFIGSDNNLFSHSGCSLIVGPYKDSRQQIVGAIGVIGPTRMNYARIIPMVDYTARLVSRLIG